MLKKIFVVLFAIIMVALLSSCGEQEEPQSEEEEIEIFKTDEGKFGLMKGEEIIAEPIYDSIEPAKGDDAAFYSYKAFVPEGIGLFLEEGGKHLYSVLEKPVERFYLLDSEGKPIVDIAFEEVELSFLLDENENLIPYYLNGLSEGSCYWYESDNGQFVLNSESKKGEEEADFGYTITKYVYGIRDFMKYGLKSGEKVIVETVADRIEIPLEDRIILYYGPTWQAFECGKCIIIDSEGNVLSEKFNRVEFVTFENGTYIGIGITAGERAEEPTFDENGERMPGGVWIIDKDGNILSENLFKTDDFMGYYTVDEDSIDMISHDDDGNEKVVEISLYEYMGEVNDSMGYDLYAAITNKEITEGKYIPTSGVLPKEVVWANEEQKKYCEDLIDGIDIDFASAFIVGTSPTEDGARVGIAKSQANEILKILKETELVISKPTNPNMPAVTEIHIAMHTGEYIKIVWDTSYFTVYEKGAEAAYRFDASKMTESFVKFSNCHNEMFLNGLGTLAQYPD